MFSHLRTVKKKNHTETLKQYKIHEEAIYNCKRTDTVLRIKICSFLSNFLGVAECKECGTVSPNGDIKEHFIGTNSPVNLQFKCKICNLILPTKCSLQAHNRIHTQTKPYICPECTREFELWASFSVHLVYTCFHLAKSVHFR